MFLGPGGLKSLSASTKVDIKDRGSLCRAPHLLEAGQTEKSSHMLSVPAVLLFMCVCVCLARPLPVCEASDRGDNPEPQTTTSR